MTAHKSSDGTRKPAGEARPASGQLFLTGAHKTIDSQQPAK